MTTTDYAKKLMDSDDPFSDVTRLDTRGMSPEALKSYGLEKPQPKDDNGFWRMDSASSRPMPTVEEMLKDPSVLEELSKSDPKLRDELIERQAEQIALDFRRATPKYLNTDGNASTVIQAMSKRHLQVDTFADDEAIRELYLSGKWTVSHIKAEYEVQLRAGRLAVPAGSYKELTRKEQLDVIACCRENDSETGITQYIAYALNGQTTPEYWSPREFLTANPVLASKAAVFVWSQLRAGQLTDDELDHFVASLKRYPLLTVRLLDDAFITWRLRQDVNQPKQTQQVVETPPTRVDLDQLSSEEIATLYGQARSQYLRQSIR